MDIAADCGRQEFKPVGVGDRAIDAGSPRGATRRVCRTFTLAVTTLAGAVLCILGALVTTGGLIGTVGDVAPSELRLDRAEVRTDHTGRIVGWYTPETAAPTSSAARERADHVPPAPDTWWHWGLPLGAVAGAFGFALVSLREFRRAVRKMMQTERDLSRAADEDPLTGLPNRRKLIALLDQALARCPTGDGVMFACVDLDAFKDVNEILGHDIGDRILAEASRRLKAVLPARAHLGRIDGDEFAVVASATDAGLGFDLVRTCTRALAAPFNVGGHVIQVGASAGFALAPRDGDASTELIRRADLAVRTAKARGRGHVVAFNHGLEDEITERRFIEQELRTAIASDALAVYYQPIVAGDGLRVVGAEALLRWTHPQRGPIPPAVFVPLAEQAGLMLRLGDFVLRRALADAAAWPHLYVAVNLSPIQVRDRGLVASIAEALAASKVDPARLVLEITEGLLIDNPEEAKQRLKELRELGIKIALDDFGSGYSSLSYLRRLPIDKLKIDKEFVAPLGRSADGGVILQAIVALGRALGLSVLVEGVETEEQRVLLRLAGCDELQGFLFARPMPADAFHDVAYRDTHEAAERTNGEVRGRISAA